MKFRSSIPASEVIGGKEIGLSFDPVNDTITASYNYKETEESNQNSTLQVTRNKEGVCITNIYNVTDISSVVSVETAVRTWLKGAGSEMLVDIKALES